MSLSWDLLRLIMTTYCDPRDSVRMSMTCTRLYKVFTPVVRALRTCGYDRFSISGWHQETEDYVKRSQKNHATRPCHGRGGHEETCSSEKPCVQPWNSFFAGLCPNCDMIHKSKRCPLGQKNTRCVICKRVAPYKEYIKRFCCKAKGVRAIDVGWQPSKK